MGKAARRRGRPAAGVVREAGELAGAMVGAAGCTPGQEAALREVWARIPGISSCKGKCWDSCGPIKMLPPERALVERHGVHIPDRDARDGPALCEALTMLRRCAVYGDRPTVCRLWGTHESTLCDYGCRPDELLTDEQAYLLLADVYEIAGMRDLAVRLRQAFANDPERVAALLEEGRAMFYAQVAAVRASSGVHAGSSRVVGRGRLMREEPGSGREG